MTIKMEAAITALDLKNTKILSQSCCAHLFFGAHLIQKIQVFFPPQKYTLTLTL